MGAFRVKDLHDVDRSLQEMAADMPEVREPRARRWMKGHPALHTVEINVPFRVAYMGRVTGYEFAVAVAAPWRRTDGGQPELRLVRVSGPDDEEQG